ncbi:hypothetical protein V6N13_015745 [Hibiscus sabdariffa]
MASTLTRKFNFWPTLLNTSSCGSTVTTIHVVSAAVLLKNDRERWVIQVSDVADLFGAATIGGLLGQGPYGFYGMDVVGSKIQYAGSVPVGFVDHGFATVVDSVSGGHESRFYGCRAPFMETPDGPTLSDQATRIFNPRAIMSGLRISSVYGLGPRAENKATTGAGWMDP